MARHADLWGGLPGEGKTAPRLGTCWRPWGSELALRDAMASGWGDGRSPREGAESCTLLYLCVWLGAVSCWDLGAAVGDTVLSPSFPGELLQLQWLCAAFLWLLGQLGPKAAQALVVHVLRGEPVPAVPWRAGTRTWSLPGWAGRAEWERCTAGSKDKGAGRKGLPQAGGARQEAAGVGVSVGGWASPARSSLASPEPHGKEVQGCGGRPVVAGACGSCLLGLGGLLLAWLRAAAPRLVLCLCGSPGLIALHPSLLPDLQLVHQCQEAAAP